MVSSSCRSEKLWMWEPQALPDALLQEEHSVPQLRWVEDMCSHKIRSAGLRRLWNIPRLVYTPTLS
jgi:hypothetical protein